jgi:DNA-binding PadR family transcriptional regulator
VSLKHALLGFLNYGPHTGYEIKKVFDLSVAHFWSAELSQIYPTLKGLENEGLVEMNVEVQADRPNRKVYSITDDGRRELLEWLGTPAEADQIREPLMIKLFFGSSLPKREILAILRQRADELRLAETHYERGCEHVKNLAAVIGLEREALFWELTLDSGVHHNRAALQWIEEAISRIQKADDSLFEAHPAEFATMDTKARVEILDKLKNAMPQAMHTMHHFE